MVLSTYYHSYNRLTNFLSQPVLILFFAQPCMHMNLQLKYCKQVFQAYEVLLWIISQWQSRVF